MGAAGVDVNGKRDPKVDDAFCNNKLADNAKVRAGDQAVCPPASKLVADVVDSDEEFMRTPETMPQRLNFSSRRRSSPARAREPSDKYRLVSGSQPEWSLHCSEANFTSSTVAWD